MNNSAGQLDDIVKLAPESHEVIFENDQIRMLKVVVKPSESVPQHRNPENVNYILEPGTLRLISPDGSFQDVELTEGQVIPAPESSHSVKNIGSTEVQTICVELKKPT